MGSKSKEEHLLALLLESSPLKEWHFEELVRATGMTRASLNKWLKRYVNDGLLTHVKEDGRFPHYTVGKENQAYAARKRLYALEQFYTSGLVQHLLTLQSAKTIIIFGSMARGDWYKDSDIDLFIYGDDKGLDKNLYEQRLGRNIEVHLFENKEELTAVKTGLIKNIINGYLVKGEIQEIAEAAT